MVVSYVTTSRHRAQFCSLPGHDVYAVRSSTHHQSPGGDRENTNTYAFAPRWEACRRLYYTGYLDCWPLVCVPLGVEQIFGGPAESQNLTWLDFRVCLGNYCKSSSLRSEMTGRASRPTGHNSGPAMVQE